MCNLSHVTSHISGITCHLSPTAIATATNLSPASSPTMHSRLVSQKIEFILKKIQLSKNCTNLQKIILNFEIWPEVSSPCGSGCHRRGQTDDKQTDITTYRLNRSRSPFSEKRTQKMLTSNFFFIRNTIFDQKSLFLFFLEGTANKQTHTRILQLIDSTGK